MGGLQASQANFDAAMITGKPENNSPSPILNNDKHKLSGTKIFLDHQSSKDEEMSSIKNDINKNKNKSSSYPSDPFPCFVEKKISNLNCKLFPGFWINQTAQQQDPKSQQKYYKKHQKEADRDAANNPTQEELKSVTVWSEKRFAAIITFVCDESVSDIIRNSREGGHVLSVYSEYVTPRLMQDIEVFKNPIIENAIIKVYTEKLKFQKSNENICGNAVSDIDKSIALIVEKNKEKP